MMNETDRLIASLYTAAVEEDWQGFRTRALTRLSQVLRLDAAAWWSRGRRGGWSTIEATRSVGTQ